VRREAAAIVGDGAIGPDGLMRLTAFDKALKRRNLNPGTSADLTVATLFLDKISSAEGRKR
jgi:triphosphoribosyl-dephospho-CoA synthase